MKTFGVRLAAATSIACSSFILLTETCNADTLMLPVSIVHTFTASTGDGSFPGALMVGNDKKLYGTTEYGGASASCSNSTNGCGTIYSFDPTTGVEAVLYSFASTDDAINPYSSLVETSAGTFYGATNRGGANSNSANTDTAGDGAIFQFSASSQTESLVYTFTGAPDGMYPSDGLTLANDGNYYGVSSQGGSSSNCSGGCGAVFRFDPGSGTVTSFYSFTGSQNSQVPFSGLLSASNGLLYGTTTGLDYSAPGAFPGGGTIFSVNPATGVVTTLYQFQDEPDACTPENAPLIQASDGNLYGVGGCGAHQNGSVYRFNPTTGVETVLYSFGATSTDGTNPQGSLCLGPDGNYYGVTTEGGASSMGTIFVLDIATGAVVTVYSFPGGAGGGMPNAGLVRASDGNLYGTAMNVIYRLTVPSAPAVTTGSTHSSSGNGSFSLELMLILGSGAAWRRKGLRGR